jgi:D-alanyl-D-alanine carboxypeptidase
MSEQGHGIRRGYRRHALVGAMVATTLLGAVACSSDPPAEQTPINGTLPTGTTPGSSPAGTTPGTEVATDAACVADPEAVATRQPTPEMTTGTLDAELVADLDAAAQESFAQAAAPGAIVGVRAPDGTWTAAYGEADPDAGTPMEVGMHTRIGSVTKTFTGTLIMQLAEAGQLSLDDTIGEYVDGVPNGDTITLLQLANMTSGVASYTQSTAFTDTYFAKPETVFTPDELLAVGISESPIFEPGEKFNYSNTNTVLLGMVIEEVTGKPVADVFDEQILQPLGLANTSWPGDSTEIPAPYAQGFTLQGDFATPDSPSNATNWNPAWGWTAGEMISNMDDLLTYGRALGTGQGLLDEASQIERLSFPDGNGYGIAMGCIDGWVGHTGELPGYNTSVFYDTTTDTTVIVQVNSDISSGDCAESPTLTDDPRTEVCSAPATRMFVALSTALGHTFTPNPSQ